MIACFDSRGQGLVNSLDDSPFIPHAMATETIGWSPERVAGKHRCAPLPVWSRSAGIQILFMGSLKKRREAKINKHKRRKKLRANRHKKRTWQK